MSVLELQQVESGYGISQILFGMNVKVEAGESVCLLGRNGVGKSTTMRTIMGELKNMSGKILFSGENIASAQPYSICRKGISYVPQGRHVFPNLTTKENLIVAQKKGPTGECDWDLERVYGLFPRLKERENSFGGHLSGGEQQMLTIARGLMQNPKLLLLDEITEGLAPVVVEELVDVIHKLQQAGVSILLAEQSVKFALAVSERCYILEKGAVAYEGNSKEIPQEVFQKYLSA